MADWTMSVTQGGTVRRTLTFTNDDGSPIDTSGWEWRARMFDRARTVDQAVTISELESGTAEVVLSKTLTAALEPTVYTLAIDWTDDSGATPEQEITATVTVRRQGAA